MRRGRHRREQGHRPGHHPCPRRRGRRGWSPALGRPARSWRSSPTGRACSRSWWTWRRPPDRSTWWPPPWTRGRLDILVNNVGRVSPRLNGSLVITDDQWLSTINLNLMAAVRTTRAALPAMLAAGHGSIVTTSSVNAFLPDPGVIDYSAAKAALTNYCKSLSKEVGAGGIRVNTVSPGPVATDLWLGDDGVAATVAGPAGATRTRSRQRGRRPVRHRPLHPPGRGRRPGRRSSPATASRQHHRLRLRHRRRPDDTAVTPPAQADSTKSRKCTSIRDRPDGPRAAGLGGTRLR